MATRFVCSVCGMSIVDFDPNTVARACPDGHGWMQSDRAA